jgi:hypothetical protein
MDGEHSQPERLSARQRWKNYRQSLRDDGRSDNRTLAILSLIGMTVVIATYPRNYPDKKDLTQIEGKVDLVSRVGRTSAFYLHVKEGGKEWSLTNDSELALKKLSTLKVGESVTVLTDGNYAYQVDRETDQLFSYEQNIEDRRDDWKLVCYGVLILIFSGLLWMYFDPRRKRRNYFKQKTAAKRI